MHIIIIIHYKHWLYDSTTPIWLYTPGLNITGKIVFLFWSSHHRSVTRPRQQRTRTAVCFCTNATWMRILASRCHRNMITRWYVKQQRRYCRPRIHKDYKRLFFFLTLQSSLCKFKIYKSRLNHVGSLKIDKRDKLLKVNILSDAKWLFGVTPKETCSKNNVILHKKSDWGLQSSQKRNNSTSLDSSPV